LVDANRHKASNSTSSNLIGAPSTQNRLQGRQSALYQSNINVVESGSNHPQGRTIVDPSTPPRLVGARRALWDKTHKTSTKQLVSKAPNILDSASDNAQDEVEVIG
jgi:hypothetical protein